MSDGPRVVSLAPSATATLSAMGAADCLVGVTAHCDLDRPVVGGWLNPNVDRLADLDPDLLLTCDDLQADIRDDLRESGFTVHHTAPTTLDDALASFEEIGATVGRPEAGRQLAADCRRRLDRVADRVDHIPADERPVVYCEEWSDPPMAAGNWVPEAVAAAGGRYPFVEPGDRSREVSESTVVAADPDHVVLHVCGHGDGVSPERVEGRGWDLDAPVHVLDDALLNQPSPRLVDGIERLADIIHATPTARNVTAAE
ncbi:iron complex transport system substrate-binding protein [Halogranum gelatinilyticum]|uniref:Iron complex transport system substrate-binding protein n=1 Tax=Halogranum gelatinilyticum TaxID=660521 RepID=A0A1G9QGM1_9EURY|nr:helical backbone metal receptor [Halogranum gelatinilyticum]SDM09445.1 iron complex transport system substrate-binding protein [Halogranum gelatinilyticum]